MAVECAVCGKVLEDRRGCHGHLRMAHNLEDAELEDAYERSLEMEFEEAEEEEAEPVTEKRVRQIAREEAEKVLREKANLRESVSSVDPSDSTGDVEESKEEDSDSSMFLFG